MDTSSYRTSITHKVYKLTWRSILTATSMHINRHAHVSCAAAAGEESAASSLERGGHTPRESKEVPRQPCYRIWRRRTFVGQVWGATPSPVRDEQGWQRPWRWEEAEVVVGWGRRDPPRPGLVALCHHAPATVFGEVPARGSATVTSLQVPTMHGYLFLQCIKICSNIK
jgi:hypothetical protein